MAQAAGSSASMQTLLAGLNTSRDTLAQVEVWANALRPWGTLTSTPPPVSTVAPPSGEPLSTGARVTARTAVRKVVAHAAGSGNVCGYFQGNVDTWSEAGANTVVWYKDEDGWCGSSSSAGNWNHYLWTWGPFCLGAINTDNGWDGSRSWIHGYYSGTVGLSYAFGCADIYATGTSFLRIANNGYYDWYNDWGNIG